MSSEENPVGRVEPPLVAGELEMLSTFLDYHRQTLLWKVSGLGEEDMRRQPVPTSTLSLVGLVKHLAYVERSWIQRRFRGAEVYDPWTPEDPDFDFRLEAGETVASVIGFYREEIETSRRIVAEAKLDDLSVKPRGDGQYVSLRWIMYHLIEETARHNGHADILREAIDGMTGE